MNVVSVVLSLVLLLATAEAERIHWGSCSEHGKTVVEWKFDCDGSEVGGPACTKTTRKCSCDGDDTQLGGTFFYDHWGDQISARGPGWDCTSRCQSSRSSGRRRQTKRESCGWGWWRTGNDANADCDPETDEDCEFECDPETDEDCSAIPARKRRDDDATSDEDVYVCEYEVGNE